MQVERSSSWSRCCVYVFLGIEFSINELLSGGRRLLWAGGSYIVLNFGAGLVLGWALGWGTREMFVMAGMIGTSSTAIVTKLILDLRRVANPETGMILGIISALDHRIAQAVDGDE